MKVIAKAFCMFPFIVLGVICGFMCKSFFLGCDAGFDAVEKLPEQLRNFKRGKK